VSRKAGTRENLGEVQKPSEKGKMGWISRITIGKEGGKREGNITPLKMFVPMENSNKGQSERERKRNGKHRCCRTS